ncbi:MAG: phosphoglucomutase/phosphomannomutase family protein, partial [Clostridia bacterium]|nr:phosphoglucomutase/phosphomannomutase family protein [Clostridia bacterium]
MIKFGTGGFRGIIGDDFTKSAVQQIAQGLCDIIKSDNLKSPVAVGYDHRFGSEYFAAWIAETLTGNGIRTLLYSEPMPSPAVMTAVRDENLDYGIMITASHNPYRFNGVKLFTRGGMDADVAVTDRLEKSINAVKDVKTSNVNQAAEKGLLTFYSNAEQYIANVKSFIDSNVKNNNLNILYNNLYGVGAKCIAPLFSQIGVKNLTVL